MKFRQFLRAIGGPKNLHRKRKPAKKAVRRPEPDYTDHDPLAPAEAAIAATEASLLAAIYSTSAAHPDYDFCRKFQPLDLRGAKDTD